MNKTKLLKNAKVNEGEGKLIFEMLFHRPVFKEVLKKIPIVLKENKEGVWEI